MISSFSKGIVLHTETIGLDVFISVFTEIAIGPTQCTDQVLSFGFNLTMPETAFLFTTTFLLVFAFFGTPFFKRMGKPAFWVVMPFSDTQQFPFLVPSSYRRHRTCIFMLILMDSYRYRYRFFDQ